MRFEFSLLLLVILVPTILAVGCQSPKELESSKPETASSSVTGTGSASARIALPTLTPTETPDPAKYPGNDIYDYFPVEYADEGHGIGESFKGRRTIKVREFEITVVDSYPVELRGPDGGVLLRWEFDEDAGYRGFAAGFARLLGTSSEQLYIVNSGPAGVCCTNYWIIDISGPRPKEIFRSEDFGHFRGTMEIFDADGDGVLELMRFDSAFRYMNDDCGSCTPQPRATFAFDHQAGKYLPAPGKRQNFAREWMAEDQKYLDENFARRDEVEISVDYRRTALAHVVDLFYEARTRDAWDAFRKYVGDDADNAKLRREISKRLSESKYYRAIKNISETH